MVGGILLSTPVQAGEEIGWRGFALPRLAVRMGFARASLVLGIVWAGWHLPQFFLAGADTYRQSFPIWAVEVVAISVALAWLYSHTSGSLLLTMLLHSAINNTKDVVPAGDPNPSGVMSLHGSPVMYLTAACLWFGAAYFLARMPRQGQHLKS
jgi:membrane protease YdiL (CAAX protease family)